MYVYICCYLQMKRKRKKEIELEKKQQTQQDRYDVVRERASERVSEWVSKCTRPCTFADCFACSAITITSFCIRCEFYSTENNFLFFCVCVRVEEREFGWLFINNYIELVEELSFCYFSIINRAFNKHALVIFFDCVTIFALFHSHWNPQSVNSLTTIFISLAFFCHVTQTFTHFVHTIIHTFRWVLLMMMIDFPFVSQTANAEECTVIAAFVCLCVRVVIVYNVLSSLFNRVDKAQSNNQMISIQMLPGYYCHIALCIYRFILLKSR